MTTDRLGVQHAPIRSYPATLWSTHCERCGAEIDSDYRTASAAREAWDHLRASEGAALCDGCWPEPTGGAA